MKIQELPIFVKSIKRLYDDYCKEVGDRLNLSRLEVDIIAFLNNNPNNNTARDISEIRMLPKSNVSAGLDSLMRKGYVERRLCKEDKRISKLSLAENSKEVRKEITKMQDNFYSRLTFGVTKEEEQMLSEIVEKMKLNVLSNRK